MNIGMDWSNMSKEDLLSIPGISYKFLAQDIDLSPPESIDSASNIQKELIERIEQVLIINIYLLNGECIKLGAGSKDMLKVSDIIKVSDIYLTIRYDSHDTNIFYNSILKIEYFYKEG